MSIRQGGEPAMDYANTYNMDTRKLQKPVVMERTERGREMQSAQFPTDIAGDIGAADRQSKGSLFHEGYIDGKLYLVPDSNLEAMKDIINLKMRRQETSKYMNMDPQREAASIQKYDQKREELLKKLDLLNLEPSVEEEEEEEEAEVEEGEAEVEEEEQEVEEEDLLEVEEEESEEEEEVKEEAEEEERSDEEEEAEEEEGAEEEEEAKEEGGAEDTLEDVEKESDEEIDTIFPGQYYNPKVKRFLISGHFRTDRKPIYIIQQYTGPSVFSSKDPQFYSHKSEKDTDIFISGEFYKESILEENKNQEPKRLNTKPRKIRIDKSSRIYEDKFSDTFVGEDVDVTLTGSFIKHTLSTMCTPMLTISLKKGTANAANNWPGNRKAAAPVYVSRPVVQNIFEKKKIQQITVPRHRTSSANNIAPLKIGKKPHKKALSKLKNDNHRQKAGHNFPYRNSTTVLAMFAQPNATGPFSRRSKRDEKRDLIKARMRGSCINVLDVPATSKKKSSGKSLTNKYHKDGKGERTAEKGLKKKRSTKKSSKLSENDIAEYDNEFRPHIDLERKIEIQRERRKGKKTQETKANAAAKLLDRLFKI